MSASRSVLSASKNTVTARKAGTTSRTPESFLASIAEATRVARWFTAGSMRSSNSTVTAESPASSTRKGAMCSLAQIRLAHARILRDGVGRSREDDRACFQHVAPIGMLERGAGVLLDQQNGGPRRFDLVD